jgi:hypothetical protein
MGISAWHEELENRGAFGAIREQPAANSHKQADNSRKPTASVKK